MDIIIDWQLYETEFAGEKVSMELRPLKSWAMFALSPYLDNPNPKIKDETAIEYSKRLTDKEKEKLISDGQKIQELSEEIFSEHVKDLQSIKVNGEDVTWNQIATESVFYNFAVEISGQLASISTLTKDEEKNSEGQSDILQLESLRKS